MLLKVNNFLARVYLQSKDKLAKQYVPIGLDSLRSRTSLQTQALWEALMEERVLGYCKSQQEEDERQLEQYKKGENSFWENLIENLTFENITYSVRSSVNYALRILGIGITINVGMIALLKAISFITNSIR